MVRSEKVLNRLLSGLSDGNIKFDGLISLMLNLGFEQRIKGSHHILTHEQVEEILNIQPKSGKAKSYQVKQVRDVIIKYRLKL